MNAMKIERPLSPDNAITYGQIVGLELALLDCNEMGIDIIDVECKGITPRLVARDTEVTRNLIADGKAISYGRTARNGVRRILNQITVRNVKVVWKSEIID